MALVALFLVQIGRNYRQRYIARTEERVQELYLKSRPERMWLRSLMIGVGGALLMAIISSFNLFFVTLGGVGGFVVPILYLNWLAARRRKKFDAQLADAIVLIAGAMRTGTSLLQAMEKVSREIGPPIKQEFAHALQENQVGKPIIQALQDMKDRIRSDDLSVTVNAMSIALETGGVLSDVLLKIAEMIRSRDRVRSKISTLSAQGRLQGIVMSFLPWALVGMLFMLDRSLMKPMFTSLIGQAVMGGVIFLEVIGYLIMSKMVALDV